MLPVELMEHFIPFSHPAESAEEGEEGEREEKMKEQGRDGAMIGGERSEVYQHKDPALSLITVAAGTAEPNSSATGALTPSLAGHRF